jgi:probable metal-binding protein
MASIHGHDVIQMIQQADRVFSRVELVTTIEREFGSSARFHTCSAADLTADGLIDFLFARGKLFGDDNALSLDASKVCQH